MKTEKNPIMESYDYFYSLMNTLHGRRKRKCLRCSKSFISSNSGNRICGTCAIVNERVKYLAELSKVG